MKLITYCFVLHLRQYFIVELVKLYLWLFGLSTYRDLSAKFLHKLVKLFAYVIKTYRLTGRAAKMKVLCSCKVAK